MPLLLMLFLFVAWPVVEIWLILRIADAIGHGVGAPAMIALLFLDSVLGSMLVRSQGRAVWREFTDALRAGRTPANEALNGALVIIGGVLLITPGFISDIVGALMVAPPTRRLLAQRAYRMIARRVKVAMRFADTRVRDFPRSDRPPPPPDPDEPDFDFEPRQLNG